MKVIGYIRVSTDEQASHGVSLGAQRAKLEQYAALYDLELVDVIVDAGASAKSLKRAGLQLALAALDAGRAQGLVITKLDRLTRSVKDLGELLETHFSSKFDLLSVEDRFDTSTAAGRLALNMMASISQWEREVIGERTSAALQHKKAQGQHVGSAGLGYQMIEGALQEDAEEQEVLERIAELKAEGMTLRAMAKQLTVEGYQPKRGERWHVSSLSRYCKKLGA
jgi:DNA invertase Pin-like site-specific DNA recombinase